MTQTQSGSEFAPATTATNASSPPNSSATSRPNNTTTSATNKQHSDILLNIFQIKKQRYRVLLNDDHIVWERLESKRVHSDGDAHSKKEVEYETERLAQRAAYGSGTNVVHINEIIKVAKGETKSATLQLTPPDGAAVLGATSEQQPQQQCPTSTPTEQYLSISYAERVVHSPTDCNRWRVRTLTLYNADPYIVRQWYTLLSKMLDSANQQHVRVRRLLVFINPFGGRKQGLQTYERFCKPLFQLAGIDASCIISQRSNQIRDILLSHDLTPFDAVCCVGGDGTVAEVINGLVFRTIRDLGMDMRQPLFIPKPSLPIAIIPAGSTDTIAYSVHGTADVRTAAIHLVLGQRRGVDICSVRNRHGIIRFCASLISYGYLGDVAAESEKYRWMGTKRYEYTGVKTFLLNRGYEAEIRILQSPEDTSNATAETASARVACCVNCMRCHSASATVATPPSLLEHSTANMTLSTKAAICDGTRVANEDIDDELPSLSNLSLYTQKSAEDNNYASATTVVADELNDNVAVKDGMENPKLTKNESDGFDSNKDLNRTDCDKTSKAVTLAKQLKKDDEIGELLTQAGIEYAINEKSGGTAQVNTVTTADVENAHNTPLNFECNSSNNTSNKITNKNNNQKPSNEENDLNWTVIKGKFFMVTGANITCACSRSPNGMSRYNHLGDGYLDLILVRNTSLLNNVRLIKNTMGRNGDISKLPFVETYRVKKFCFRTPYPHTEEDHSVRGSCQPITSNVANDHGDDDKVSCWNCDGEVVSDLELTMSSHCQLIDVFMRGPHTYSESVTSDSAIFCCCKSNQ